MPSRDTRSSGPHVDALDAPLAGQVDELAPFAPMVPLRCRRREVEHDDRLGVAALCAHGVEGRALVGGVLLVRRDAEPVGVVHPALSLYSLHPVSGTVFLEATGVQRRHVPPVPPPRQFWPGEPVAGHSGGRGDMCSASPSGKSLLTPTPVTPTILVGRVLLSFADMLGKAAALVLVGWVVGLLP